MPKVVSSLIKIKSSYGSGFSKPLKILIDKFSGSYGFKTNDLELSSDTESLLESQLSAIFVTNKQIQKIWIDRSYDALMENIYDDQLLDYFSIDLFEKKEIKKLLPLLIFMFLDSRGARHLSDKLRDLSQESLTDYIKSPSLIKYLK